jgi:hypothetical protein
LLVSAPAAQANHIRPNLGLEVTSVDPATRTVQGIVHCTTPDRAGRPATFTVTPDISFEQFAPGVVWGIAVDPSNVIRSTGDMPCNLQPQGPPPGPGGSLLPGDGPQGGPVPGPGDGPIDNARIYKDGRRVPASSLAEVDGEPRVHGKLLPPRKWEKDEDGEPVPTIRARKVYLS